jgi:hypothetical protein
MAYTTLPEGADLMQSKTHAFVIVDISEDIDLGYFWYKAAGNANGKLKVTLVKLDNTTVVKLAEDGEVALLNTSPPKIKVLIEPTDIDFIGALKVFPEFKIDDSWIQADRVVFTVVDDPIPS